MTYRVIIVSSARREIDKLPQDTRQRIVARITSLEQDPRPNGAIKMQGTLNTYRVRVGDYRIVYTIDDGIRVATVTRVGHRREVYR